MAWKSFTGGVAYIYPAAFQSVYVKGTTAAKWQTLGAITGGVLNIQDFAQPDSLGRNKAINAYNFTAKCNMMQAGLIELELLDHLCDGTNAFLFKMTDAATVSTSAAYAGWIYVTAAQVGIKAKVNCDGTPENNRVIELEWQGSILKSDADEISLYTPTLETADFCSNATTTDFYTLGIYTASTDGGSANTSAMVPNGVSSVTIDGAGLSSADTISPVSNVKMSYEFLPSVDALRRFLPNALDINVEYEWMATKNSDLLLLGNASQSDIKTVITMLDGVIFTLDNKTGLETNFEATGDMENNRIVRMTHKGKVLQSTFDSIVSS